MLKIGKQKAKQTEYRTSDDRDKYNKQCTASVIVRPAALTLQRHFMWDNVLLKALNKNSEL